MSCAIAGGGDGGLLVDHCHHANPSRVAFQVVAIDFLVLDVSQVSLAQILFSRLVGWSVSVHDFFGFPLLERGRLALSLSHYVNHWLCWILFKLMDFSKFLHGFLYRCYMDLSKLIIGFL